MRWFKKNHIWSEKSPALRSDWDRPRWYNKFVRTHVYLIGSEWFGKDGLGRYITVKDMFDPIEEDRFWVFKICSNSTPEFKEWMRFQSALHRTFDTQTKESE